MEILVLIFVSWIIQISVNLYSSFKDISYFFLFFYVFFMAYFVSYMVTSLNIKDIKMEALKFKEQFSKEYIQKLKQIDDISFFNFIYKPIDFFVKNKRLKNEHLQDINKDLSYFRRLLKLKLTLLFLFLILPSKKLLLLIASYFILNQDIVKNFLTNLF